MKASSEAKNDLDIIKDILVGDHISKYQSDQAQLQTTLEEQQATFEAALEEMRRKHQAEMDEMRAAYEQRIRNLEASIEATQQEVVQELRVALKEQRDKLNKLGKRFAMLGTLLSADEEEATTSG